MNAINRVELAIRRAASQMPKELATPFLLLASELALVVHDGNAADEKYLSAYREHQ